MTERKFTVSEVVDSFGVNKFTWLTFVFLGIAMVFDGYDFMIANATNLAVAHTYWPDNPVPGPLMGALASWSVIGMIMGSACGGILSDKFGRKKVLVGAILFYSLFTFPQAASPSFFFHAAFRVIAGLGIGACIPVVTTMFSENMPSKNRGVFITFGMAFMIVGWVVAGLVGNPITNADVPIIPGFTEQVTYLTTDSSGAEITGTMYANWRVCYLLGGIPLVYGIFLIFFLKETPHWYANNNRVDDAVKRLAQIEKQARGTVTIRDPELLLLPPKPDRATNSPVVLFSKKYVLATCAIWSTYFIGQFCIYGMNTWIPSWFTGLGYAPSDAVMLQTFNNVAAIVSNISVGFVSDRVGRKRNLAFGWLLSIAAIILCSLFVSPNSMLVCICLMLLFGFSLNYALTAVQPLLPESYPTQFRNMGVSWCQAFARFGGATAPIILGSFTTMGLFQVNGITNWNLLVLILIVPLALGLVCTLLFVQRETKGKSIDAIQTEIEAEV